MDILCTLDNAYSNNGALYDNFNKEITSDDLDKMARKINNDKRKRTKDAYKQFRNSSTQLHDSSVAFGNIIKSQADVGTYLDVSNQAPGFYSAQGDYSEYKPYNTTGTLIKDIIKEGKKNDKHSKSSTKYEDISLDISIDTPSESDLSSDSLESSLESSDISDSSYDTNEIDRQIKTKSKFNTKKRSKRHRCVEFDLDSVDSLESLDSGESLLRHIRFCKGCKDKVMGLIKKHKHELRKKGDTYSFSEESDSRCMNIMHTVKKMMNDDRSKHKSDDKQFNFYMGVPQTKEDSSNIEHVSNTVVPKKEHYVSNSTDSWTDSKFPEIRDIISVCLIGFIIIVVLDLLMKSK